jgi:putative FmdB family regulatory protein
MRTPGTGGNRKPGCPRKVDKSGAQRQVGGMPLYEYELCEGSCAACGGRFTLRRPVTAAELKACPACKKPVRKVISTFNSPTKLKPVSVTDAKKAGFTVYKKLGKGEYERQ